MRSCAVCFLQFTHFTFSETISLHERWCGSSEAKLTRAPLILAFSFSDSLLCLDGDADEEEEKRVFFSRSLSVSSRRVQH